MGSIRFEAKQAWFEDFIDWFPLENGGEARGNIGDAQRLHLGIDATIRMDTLGWKGARFDVAGRKRFMSVIDPFTGEDRDFSGDTIDLIEIDFRHDVPDTDWAWGSGLFSNNQAPYSRRYEEGRGWEGPAFMNVFVEHKDVMGLTVKAMAGNILGARRKMYRTVYETSRPDSDVLFREDTKQRIGPIFRFEVSGDF